MDVSKLLVIFATVLKYGSMNAAAPHLRMSASAISQHIRTLEAHYRIKLLNRTTRKLVPTEEGKVVWKYAQQLVELLEKIDDEVGNLKAEPSGEVKITLPTGSTQLTVMQQVIHNIRLNFPAIRLVLCESDKIEDLMAEGSADIAIRVVPQPDNEALIVRPLATWQTIICAAPSYLAQHPIQSPLDLLSAHWLNFHQGVLLSVFATLKLPQALPKSRTDCQYNASAAKDLVRLGLGLTIMTVGEIQEDLVSGRLVTVLPDYPLPTRTIYAVTVNRGQSAKVQAVLNTLKDTFAHFRYFNTSTTR